METSIFPNRLESFLMILYRQNRKDLRFCLPLDKIKKKQMKLSSLLKIFGVEIPVLWLKIIRKAAYMLKRKYNQEEAEQANPGRIYINREDARIFVRKSGLYAWTMNLGNPWSWVIMGLELLVILLITGVFFF